MMRTLQVRASDGVVLHVEVHEPAKSTGPPVLFSCAYVTTLENWRTQVEPLRRAGHSVILWDYRGHGRSDAPEEESAYSIEQIVDDMGRVLDSAAAGEKPVLAGLSFGGLASLHFVLRHPERVRALALVDSGPGFKNPEAAERWMKQVGRTGEFLMTRGFEAFMSGKAAPTCIGRRPELPAAKAAAAAICEQNAAAIALFGLRVAGPAPPVIDDLAGIDKPALIVVGEEDAAYLRAGEVMAAKLPAATHRVIPGAGHIVNIEETDRFNAILLEFLGGLPPENS